VKNQQLVNGEDEEQDDVSEPGTWSHASDIDSQTGVKEVCCMNFIKPSLTWM